MAGAMVAEEEGLDDSNRVMEISTEATEEGSVTVLVFAVSAVSVGRAVVGRVRRGGTVVRRIVSCGMTRRRCVMLFGATVLFAMLRSGFESDLLGLERFCKIIVDVEFPSGKFGKLVFRLKHVLGR